MSSSDQFAAFIHEDTAKVWQEFGVRMGEMMAEMMEKRICNAMRRESSVTKAMPPTKRAEVAQDEPIAWAVVYPNGEVGVIAFRIADAKERAAASDRIEPLYRASRAALTEAEREAICQAVTAYDGNDDDAECAKIAATLRLLLERTK